MQNRSAPRTRTVWARGPANRVLGLILAIVVFGLSLGAMVRVSALPAEARTSETWYAYGQLLDYDFAAAVKQPNPIYPGATVQADQLVQYKLPGDPPVYRRTLLSRLTDKVVISLPYRFTADRDAQIRLTYKVDGMLIVPNLWQRPYPVLPEKQLTVNGSKIDLQNLEVEIPVREIIAELDQLTEEMKLNQEQAELHLYPVFTVEVGGLRQPVRTGLTPELVLNIRSTKAALDLDEPQSFTGSKQFTESKVVPLTMNILGWEAPVAQLRLVALAALTIVTLVLAAMILIKWLQQRTKASDDLKRLGTSLIVAKGFELPGDATIVDVHSVQQMISLHLQTDRPVIRVSQTCYLLDGNTCYRLRLVEVEAATAD